MIADDHAIFREGLQRLLEIDPGFAVIGLCGDGAEALRLVEELKPDLLLLDLSMPVLSGVDTLMALRDRQLDVRVVVLTADVEREDVVRVMQLGARGVLIKNAAIDQLYACIRAVMAGEFWVAPDQFAQIVETLRDGPRPEPLPGTAAGLTLRELQIVAAVVEGATNKQIGDQLGLSRQTIKNHLSRVFDKLGVDSRLELVLHTRHHRLLENITAAQLAPPPKPAVEKPARPKTEPVEDAGNVVRFRKQR
ncbi:MAG TPA: response regulator transcription factor [Vicinamibacterales bacterium]